jgi:hypothetical protein
MHPLFSTHPAFARALVGLLLGFAFWLALEEVAAGPDVVSPIILFFWWPIFGAMSVASWLDFDDYTPLRAPAMILSLFFYPVLFAIAGFFLREHQAKGVVIAEAMIAACVLALWIHGATVFNTMG